MFRLILLAVIIYILSRWLRHSPPPAKKSGTFHAQNGHAEEMVQDPVCGTWVPVGQALTLNREKQTLHFCSSECREKFLQAPKTN
jgi:uncharacterized protein